MTRLAIESASQAPSVFMLSDARSNRFCACSAALPPSCSQTVSYVRGTPVQYVSYVRGTPSVFMLSETRSNRFCACSAAFLPSCEIVVLRVGPEGGHCFSCARYPCTVGRRAPRPACSPRHARNASASC